MGLNLRPSDIDKSLLLRALTGHPPETNAQVHRLLSHASTFVVKAPIAASLQAADTGSSSDLCAEIVAETVASNMLLRGEISRLARRFADADIDVILLKGGAQLAYQFDGIFLRHIDDLDLLVRQSDFLEAKKLLAGLGYSDWLPAILQGPAPDGGSLADYAEGREHAAVPMKSEAGILVDLHRSLPERQRQRRADFTHLFRTSQFVDVDGTKVRVPMPDQLLRHLCDHVLFHHHGHPRMLPRHITDIRRLEPHCMDPRIRSALAGTRASPWTVFLSGHFLRAAHGTSSLQRFLEPMLFTSERALNQADRLALGIKRVRNTLYDIQLRPSIFGRKLFPASNYLRHNYLDRDEKGGYEKLIWRHWFGKRRAK